jgi:NADPH2:quinone reductase
MSTVFPSQATPGQRKAVFIDRFGDPDEVLRVGTLPTPELDRGEVLVRVAAAGVGAWDPAVCQGELGPPPAGFPLVLGSDGSGTIVKTVDGSRFRPQDRVYGFALFNPKGGFFTEYEVLSENELARIPDSLSDEQAGALAVDGLTALAGLDRLEIKKDDSLMIIGASGGIGHLALQLARRLGATVFAVASGDDGVSLVQRLGAEGVADGRRESVSDIARDFAPNGFDAALVLAGGGPAAELLKLVKQAGRIAYPHGVEPKPAARPGVKTNAYDGYHGREALERLNEMISTGPFHVEVSRIYPLESALQALKDVERHHLGKLAVRVAGS